MLKQSGSTVKLKKMIRFDPSKQEASPGLSREKVLRDYHLCSVSRELSINVRKEVLNGRAKFGSGGAGKEVPQVAMAHAFHKGDFLAGYYRDQTFMLAKELLTPENFFAFLYGDATHDPFSGGRQMNNCYGTPLVDGRGHDLQHREHYNVTSVIAPVAGHMGRALGLALASKKYRESGAVNQYSDRGSEVCFCTIGDASTSEGVFFEAVNAAGVMRVPLAIFIWDDGYGISVPTSYQTTKQSISEVLEGFRVNDQEQGLDIYVLKAWDYHSLVTTIEAGVAKVRETHIPAVFHIKECTQPLGHSTSGSHERYKPTGRLQWEKEMDAIRKMEEWIIRQGLATEEELAAIRTEASKEVEHGRQKAWKAFQEPNERSREDLRQICQKITAGGNIGEEVRAIRQELDELVNPVLSHLLDHARRIQFATLDLPAAETQAIAGWIENAEKTLQRRYHTHLTSETERSALRVPVIEPQYEAEAPVVNGFEVLNAFFDRMLEKYPTSYAFGEDVGRIGGVNQAFAGLQARYGEERVFDTGIREWTIAGQAMGMAMRGLRPIGEIQYLDYLAYAFSPLTDDLATLRFRTNGLQAAPAIIRTRGHRLEGIWHSGSPMGMLLHSMRGIYLLTPRNMTQAVGMYHTMLQSDDPAIIIECLNGYRQKEPLPANIGEYTVPLGIPEVLETGDDVTLVTYGSCVRVAQEGIRRLERKGISVELIDVQTLLPFDREQRIVESLKKTNRIVFMDEDVPGGATAFMLQEVLEKQGGYRYLDSPPATLTASDHRPPYGDDGNYSSKPNANDVFMVIYEMMRETEPARFPGRYLL